MGIEQAIDITSSQRETVLALIQQYLPGVAVWAYGSRVKWTSRPQSDLDLVTFTSPEQKDRVSDLREAFEESDLPFRVDLFVWDEVPESFKEQIEAEYVELTERRNTSNRWKNLPLSTLTDIRFSNVDKKTDQSEVNVCLCNYKDVYYNNFIYSDMEFMRATATEREIKKCTLYKDDVVITKDSEKYDDIGVPALVRENIKELVCGYHLAIIRPLEQIYGPYLFYALSALPAQKQFHSYANGVTRFGLRKADIGAVELPVPPHSEQRTIAHILSTLDDKIELNRHMNETLEEIARALFKSWFVDFDPVRAKMENRDTGLPKHIADLFPDRLVGSELGQIPEEWSIGHAGDIFKQLHEKENPLSYPRRKFQYFSIPAFDKRRWPKTEFGENIKSQKSKVPLGAVLLSKLNPDIERVWAVDVAERDQAICSTEFLVLFPRPAFGRAFVYSLVCSSFFQHKVQTLVTGTSKSHQRAHAKAILDLSVVLPPVSLSRLFEEVGEMLLCRTFQCHRESELLSTLRDALLLKLISGELKVNDRRVRGLH